MTRSGYITIYTCDICGREVNIGENQKLKDWICIDARPQDTTCCTAEPKDLCDVCVKQVIREVENQKKANYTSGKIGG